MDVVPHERPKPSRAPVHANAAVFELADADALTRALQGCTTVLQLIGTTRRRFASGDTYETSDIGTTAQLVAGAKRAGVGHFVLLSSAGTGRPWGAYLRTKARAEALVVESGIPYTIFRPSMLTGTEGRSAPPGAEWLTRALGLERWRPISVQALSSAMLLVAEKRAPLGRVLEGEPLWQAVAQSGFEGGH